MYFSSFHSLPVSSNIYSKKENYLYALRGLGFNPEPTIFNHFCVIATLVNLILFFI